MKPTRLIVLFVILLTVVACQKQKDYPSETNSYRENFHRTITSLRSTTEILSKDDLLFSIWDAESKDSILITTATNVGGEWHLQEKCTLDQPAYVSAVYPSTLLRSKEAVLITESQQSPVYYSYVDLASSSDRSLALDFKLVQAKIRLLFDISAYPQAARIEEIRFIPRYSYGWLNLREGVFNRMNTEDYERPTIVKTIGKSIEELVSGGLYYEYEYLMLPQKDTELIVWIVIDGVEHYAPINFDHVKSNTEYTVKIDLFNRGEVAPITPEEKEKGYEDLVAQIEPIFFTDYEFTATHQYMQDLSNNAGVVMNFWLDSRIAEEENLDYRLLIRDTNDNIVSQSPIFSGLSIKPYHYDGFAVPFYLSVPVPGRYKYQLLLKGSDGQWYEPDQKFDDTPEDKYFNVHPEQKIFVSAFHLTETSGKTHSGPITDLRYDTVYTSEWSLNNYSEQEERITIKLYNRRQPFENHSRMDLENSETWCDYIGERSFVVPPKSSYKAMIPYTITRRRPSVNRYLPYVCGTIIYHTPNTVGLEIGKEYPLLSDGNILYRKSHDMKNPNSFISGSWVNNRGHIDVH